MRHDLDQPRSRQRSHTLASRLAIAHHPVHPMLVVFPIALLSLVLPADVLYLWTRDPFWATAAYWATLGGLGGGVVAGAVGFADMFALRVVRRHVSAWNHLIAAVMLVALAAAGTWWRHDDAEGAVWPWGVVLSAASALMVVVTGWLGGTLTFRHGIGVYGEDEVVEDGDDRPPGA